MAVRSNQALHSEAQPNRDAFNYLVTTDGNASKTLAGVVSLKAQVDALPPAAELTPAQLEALAAQVSTSPTLAEKIAELVAQKLAARLAD